MVEEFLLVLLGLCVAATVVLLPIIAFGLALTAYRRVGRLEEQLAALRSEGKPLSAAKADSMPNVQAAPVPVVPEPVAMPPAIVTAQVVDNASRGTAPPRIAWEQVVGKKVLGWVAVLLMFFAAAFFLRHMMQYGFLGPLGRVAIAVIGGLAALAAGRRCHRRGQTVLAPMLNSAGVIVTYLAVYGSFAFYRLLPQQAASVVMLVVIVEAAVLAGLYNSWSLGLVTVLGGLATPVLLHSDRDQYQAFFLYLVALNLGVAGLTLWRTWRSIGTVALLGTTFLFWMWYDRNFHPEKFSAALSLLGAVYGLWLTHGIAAHWRPERPVHWQDLLRMLLNAWCWFAGAYVLLEPDYRMWLGSFAVVMGAVYVAYGRLLLIRQPLDPRHVLAAVAIAISLLTAAWPIQADAPWVALGWAAGAAALWWCGLRLNALALRAFAAPLAVLAVLRHLSDWPRYGREPFCPVFNEFSLPGLGVIACLLIAAWLGRRCVANLHRVERWAVPITAALAIALLWNLLTVETRDWCQMKSIQSANVSVSATQPEMADPSLFADDLPARWRWTGEMATSVLWGLYAMALLVIGFRVRSAVFRWGALLLFFVTTMKVLFWDMAGLQEIYRILAFFLVALLLGVAGWAYQRTRSDETSEVLHAN